MSSTEAGLDLFVGIPVRDLAAAQRWYERLLGGPPAMFPRPEEAVWELAEHRYAYIVEDPERAGRALVTAFVGDLDTRLDGISARGIEPERREEYTGGVRKVTYRDADGNEVSFAGGLTGAPGDA